MIKQIVKDVMFLSQKSVDATKDDLHTLANHREGCVGMAANMIGYLKNIIIIDHDGEDLVMYNPKITKTFGNVYETEEGCLSLDGVRPTKRYPKIKVQWLDASWKVKIKTFEGFSAQIIQHEIDHCNGIII